MIDTSLLEPINSWKIEGHPQFCIGVDVGGSGLRIRLSNFLNEKEYICIPHIKAQSTKEMLSALEEFSKVLHSVSPTAESKGAAIAVAGPINNNTVVFTNWPGSVAERTTSLSQLPRALFPEGKSYFLNDLEAGAYGVIAAQNENILEPAFDQLFQDKAPKGPIMSVKRTAVLAMGSGFGVALVVNTPLLKSPLVVPTELGHVQIPINMKGYEGVEEEQELIQAISDHYYGGKYMPEFEDICSGRGLPLAYEFFYNKSHNEKLDMSKIDAGVVAMKASEGDNDAYKALLWHYKLFIRAAKGIGTSLSCDSILLALDNQVKNLDFVKKIEQDLKKEFYEWIRPDWLDNIRVYTQTKVLNFNILGTTYMAQQIAHE